ncbi:MAG: DUF1365 domain-containing protein [Gammaproteobacteria bacterium]|nr:DUF1365 domain-containing protein [Gammaproteobacteria bacterium]MCP4089269.1 DUF1365 domain-containing protein [Gammaproteobacteria bacterium]MCP4275307.1 DUF1365 domain-containing protein [Gammaproteobacteria bacterium]MCP4830909.1 DUF1365 domain-containing protein [Gammaproteobacteria bacterium]MCP4929516.1 DUF1365 domain-containing protein [Gammaproteobacteria bacterium]
MSVFQSALYQTHIAHRRKRPKKHKLQYGAFYLLLDLDELDRMHRKLKWFSYNSFNIFSFHDSDHGPGTKEALRPWVEHHLEQAGVDLEGGSIQTLCIPRILGYVFNPITVYYCYHKDGQMQAVLYEVSNTFGQRHSYLFTVDETSDGLLKHSCAKRFFVSPFLEVSGCYEFSIKRPGKDLYLHIRQTDEEGPLLDAWVNGTKNHISDHNLLLCLFRYPLLTLKVIGGIHWEALKIWLKGIGVIKRPEPPAETVTIVNGKSE